MRLTLLLRLLKVTKHPAVRCIIVIAIWIIAHKIYCKLYRKYKKLPPGPDGIPLLGSLPWLAIYRNKARTYLPNKYSKYITLWWIGSITKVMIHDASIARQVFSNSNCQERPPFFNSMIANEPDVLRVKYGKQWKERRKLIRSTLLTMEDSNYVDMNIKIFIEKYISPKITMCMKEHGNINTKEISLSIRHLTFSMIIKVMFGKELSVQDPLFIKLDKLYEDWSLDAAKAALWNLSPITSAIAGEKQVKHVRNLEKQLDQLIKEKFFDVAINNNINNRKKETYFDHACSYINNQTLNKSDITLNQLLMDFRILIQASIDTTTFVLQCGLLNLIKYPSIQKMLYKELFDVFPNGIFELKQVVKCPQFRAYVNEVLRVSLPIPGGVPRYTKKDINAKFEDNDGNKYEYVIPKGSTVNLNLAYMHYYNRQKWTIDNDQDDEKEIYLDNWLVYDGDKIIFKNRKDVFPFSVGSRDCVGRSLAMRLLYSIFATFILKYKLDKYDDNFEIKIKHTTGGTHRVDTDCGIVLKTRE